MKTEESYEKAMKIANSLFDFLLPVCLHIAIAGSLQREQGMDWNKFLIR